MINRLEYLSQLLAASPKDPFLLFAVAKEHEKAGDSAKAEQFYLQVKAADPNYTGLYYHLGKLYERQQNIEAALSVYKNGIEICRTAGDRHALSELQGALLNLEDSE